LVEETHRINSHINPTKTIMTYSNLVVVVH